MVEIQRLLEETKKDWEALSWEGTFEQYLNMVVANPDLARYSHARIYDMIQWAGVAPGLDGVPRYKLFEGEIFGMDRALDRLVQFFHAAARGLEVRKRILLLMGPPASGKSSIVGLLKAGLERYSRTDAGAVYAIKGCPMQEEPLHLIPEERREEMAREHGLYIEGDLCPRCRYNLRHEYAGDVAKVKVHRTSFSQTFGVGMGSFVATSPQSQDMARLVGSVDMSHLTDDRLDGAGRALRLDGELQAANRGIMEFIEIFKSEERFLTVMLGVIQEQVIKLGSFGSVYADEATIAHSNEEEYNAFINNKETAALLDRLILIKIPYNLRVSDEVRIYANMLADSRPGGPDRSQERVCRAPLTLRVAAVLSVLSRLEVPAPATGFSRIPLLTKMKLYDGQTSPSYTKEDVERLREECPRDGMFGISPRYVINRLAAAMTRERRCLTPAKALKSLAEGLAERAGIAKGERETTVELIRQAVAEYKDLAVREVQRAATAEYPEKAAELFQSYVRDAVSHGISQKAGVSGVTQPDAGVLRRVEGGLNLRDGDRPRFRQEVLTAYRYIREHPELPGPGYNYMPTLKLAIENTLFTRRDELRLTIDPGRKDAARERGWEEIVRRLLSDYGYCEDCAKDLMYFAWRTLQGRDVISIKGGKVSWG